MRASDPVDDTDDDDVDPGAEKDGYLREQFLLETGYARGAVGVPPAMRLFDWEPRSYDLFVALRRQRCTFVRRRFPAAAGPQTGWRCGDLVRVLRPASPRISDDDPAAFLVIVTHVIRYTDPRGLVTQTASIRRLRLTTLSR